MARLDDIIAQRLRRLEAIPDEFLGVIKLVQRNLLIELLELTSSLEVDNSLIVFNESNLSKIGEISTRLKSSMFEGEYRDLLVSFSSEFETQALLNNDIFRELLGQKFTEKDIFASMVQRAQRETLNLLNGDAMESQLFQPLRQILNNSVASEQSFKDATKLLSEFMTGKDEDLGKLERYANTFVRDAFTRADGQYTMILADEFEIKWFKYSGGRVKDSRVFCINRISKIFHRDQIAGWGEGIGIDSGRAKGPERAGFPWQGMFKGTDKENIFTVRGGHNCLHGLIAIAGSAVPQSIKDEAKSMGFAI